MATCDAKYRFILTDIGAYGRESDRNIYATSDISKAFEDGTIGFPPDCVFPGRKCNPMPYVVVGDNAFPLKRYLLKPFPGRTTGLMPQDEVILNYR